MNREIEHGKSMGEREYTNTFDEDEDRNEREFQKKTNQELDS